MGMQFVTLRVTQRFWDVSWIEIRLKSAFHSHLPKPLLGQTPPPLGGQLIR
ncbi:hypothetical protein GIW25_23520 [Pseudomonas syringae]|nr:hypothetical protein [Pseudomonas syringae]